MSRDWQADVEQFHSTFGLLINRDGPSIPNEAEINTSIKLIEEEVVSELLPALQNKDLIGIADGAIDSIYVILGALIRCGIEAQSVWDEVHRSNMSKVGGHINENGKYVKPDTYSKADIQGELDKQKKEKLEWEPKSRLETTD